MELMQNKTEIFEKWRIARVDVRLLRAERGIQIDWACGDNVELRSRRGHLIWDSGRARSISVWARHIAGIAGR